MQQHAFICICTAKSSVPAPRGCLRGSDPQAILLTSFLVWRCILVPTSCTWHVMSTLPCCSPSFSHCHSPSPVVPLSLCSVLTTFCKRSWLHHVAAFIWSETPQAAPARGIRQHFASWCNPWRQALQQKAAAELGVEGDVAFPRHLFNSSHAFSGQQIEGLVCGGDIAANGHVQGGQAARWLKGKATLPESHGLPMEAGNSVLVLSWTMLLRSRGMLSKAMSPGSEPTQGTSSNISNQFLDCICKSKGLLSYLMNHPAMQKNFKNHCVESI